jgi:hypothetical protein
VRIEDVRMMMKLGVLHRNADEIEILMIHGFLIHDPVVWERKVAAARAANTCIIPQGASEKIVAEMTPEERAALRERILDKCDRSPIINKVTRDGKPS